MKLFIGSAQLRGFPVMVDYFVRAKHTDAADDLLGRKLIVRYAHDGADVCAGEFTIPHEIYDWRIAEFLEGRIGRMVATGSTWH